MAKQRPLALGEQRRIVSRPHAGLTREQRDFASVTLQKFGDEPVLLLVFGDRAFELPGNLARDFGTRIARAMRTRIAPGERRGFRCSKGLAKAYRRYVEVFMQDDEKHTWLRLEFEDGNTVDFSMALTQDFADRIARAMLLITPEGEPTMATTTAKRAKAAPKPEPTPAPAPALGTDMNRYSEEELDRISQLDYRRILHHLFEGRGMGHNEVELVYDESREGNKFATRYRTGKDGRWRLRSNGTMGGVWLSMESATSQFLGCAMPGGHSFYVQRY